MTSSKTSVNPSSTAWWKDILFLLLFLGSLFFILLGTKPLFVPDEGRYAEIAREMATSGHYVTPYLNGIKYFEKPALFYWLGAAAIKLAGLNLWSLRSINALLGLLGCLVTYACTRHLYDRTTGLLAALILGTSFLYFAMVHMISLDLPVSVFLTITLLCFLLGFQTPAEKTRLYYFWGAALAAALAVLSKGLIGIVFPLMIISSWIILTQSWQSLGFGGESRKSNLSFKSLYLPSSLFIFLLITLPWHILVNHTNPEFFDFYFIEQHVLRYTTKEVGHYQPAWFFIPNLIIGFFPWIIFLPQALIQVIRESWKNKQQQTTELFFLCWALCIFIFFSFSKSKLIPYILPVFPPLAILTARYLRQTMLPFSNIKIPSLILLALSLSMIGIIHWFIHSTPLPHPHTAASFLYLGASSLVMSAFLGCLFTMRRSEKSACKTIGAILVGTWLFLIAVLASIPSIDTRTIQPLAMTLKTLIRPHDEVITYNQYYQDLPFYLERRVSILNWKNELTYGMQHQPSHEWMINDNQFWQRFHSQQRVFVFISKEEYQHLVQHHPSEKIFLLGKTLTNFLISNQKVS